MAYFGTDSEINRSQDMKKRTSGLISANGSTRMFYFEQPFFHHAGGFAGGGGSPPAGGGAGCCPSGGAWLVASGWGAGCSCGAGSCGGCSSSTFGAGAGAVYTGLVRDRTSPAFSNSRYAVAPASPRRTSCRFSTRV